MSSDRHDQRHRGRADGADPVGQGAKRRSRRLPGRRSRSAGEREVVPVLRDQHQGQQVGAGTAAGDRMEWRRRLRDRLAGAAAELLADVLDHLPATRHAFEASRSRPRRASGRAPPQFGQAQGAGIDDPLARQVLRQRAPGRLAGARRALSGLAAGAAISAAVSSCGGGLLELGQLQLELGDDRRPALGGLPVLLAPGLGEEQLQALDLQPGAGSTRRLGLRSRAARSARIIACAAARSAGSGRMSVITSRREARIPSRSCTSTIG